MLLPNVLLRKAGLLTSSTNGPVQIVSQSGAAMVYVLDDANRPALIAQVRKALSGLKGVSKILAVDEFKDYGVANPKDDPHAPDLILFAEEGCTFGDTADGDLPFADKPERRARTGTTRISPLCRPLLSRGAWESSRGWTWGRSQT